MHSSFSQSKKAVAQQQKKVATSETYIKKSQGPEYQLEQLLTCHICLCLARNLMMCPHCSKIYCQQCIRKSLLIKQQCPHCRKHIRDIKSMANCDRFVNEIKGIVEEVLKQRNSENFKCEQHDVVLNYYCVECQKPVCCQCKMFGSHSSHQFVQVDRKYKEKYEDLRQMLAELKVCIREKQDCIGKLQSRLSQTQVFHQQELKQIQKLQRTYNDAHIRKVQKHQQKSKQNAQKLEQKLKKLTETKKQLKNEINKAKSQGKFYINQQYKQILENTIQSFNIQTQQIKRDSMSYESYLTELIPAYQMNTFIIENFSQKQQQQKLIIYSDPVQILGCQWRLKIHPNGTQSVEGKYFSIYVMMVSKNTQNPKILHQTKKDPTFYQYCIEIVKPNKSNEEENQNSLKNEIQQMKLNQKIEKRNFLRQYTSSFQPGESWGYNKFIEISELYTRELIDFKNNDRLTIKFGIRRPDYYTQYQSLCKQLENIEHKIKQKQNKEIIKD